MLISMAFASSPWRSDQRTATCFAVSLAAHALALFAALPAISVLPRTLLPSLDVRLVEVPPAALEPAAGTVPPEAKAAPPVEAAREPLPDRGTPAPEAAPEVLTAASRPDPVIAEKPKAADSPPQAEAEPPAPEPALTEAEKAKFDPRYLAESQVDRKAVSLDETRAAEYPPEALRDGITGCVLVMVYIGPGGTVENIDVIRSDPPQIFDRPAMRSFISKRYLPAIRGNVAVRSRVPGVASFELDGKPQPYCALRYYPVVRELNGDPVMVGQDAK